jgi:hypothetical protein
MQRVIGSISKRLQELRSRLDRAIWFIGSRSVGQQSQRIISLVSVAISPDLLLKSYARNPLNFTKKHEPKYLLHRSRLGTYARLSPIIGKAVECAGIKIYPQDGIVASRWLIALLSALGNRFGTSFGN